MVVRRVLINESFRIRNVVTRCWRLDNKHTVLCSAPEWEAGVMPYCIAHGSRLNSSDRVHLARCAPLFGLCRPHRTKLIGNTVIAELWGRLEL